MIKHSLITAATLSLLIGCGSEDDSLLSLESYQPQNEANDVPADSTITLSLNGPVNVVSLDSDLITLTSTVTNRSISGDISYDQNTQQVTFQPDHKLAVNTEYSVNLKAGVNDGANQSIDETNWSFTTNGDYEFQLMNLTETCNDVCDSELWLVADGGEVRQIANINPTNSSYPSASTIQYKGLYFVSAEDGTHGRELWVTDGTESYTELFADLVAGTASSYPGQFTQLGDYLYFTANNGTNNGTLWRTDGTVEGTIEVANPRPNSSPGISDLRTFNQKLIFTEIGRASCRERV